ncbi:hypothetical protein QBC40DRAFT_202071, partial [Triangularia verruculosa]
MEPGQGDVLSHGIDQIHHSTNGNCNILTGRCCGRGSYMPIYINPELQGCYSPIIPGYKASQAEPEYECVDYPSSLLGPPKTLAQPSYPASLIINTGPALIRPPSVSAGQRIYLLNGCYGNSVFGTGGGTGVLNSALSLVRTNISPATLDNCASICNTNNYDVMGMVNGRDCYCSSTVNSGLTFDNMATCKIPCLDANNIACGGPNSPVVYAVNGGGVFSSYVSTQIITPYPTYACQGRATSFTTTSTTTTSTVLSLEVSTSTTTTTVTSATVTALSITSTTQTQSFTVSQTQTESFTTTQTLSTSITATEVSVETSISTKLSLITGTTTTSTTLINTASSISTISILKATVLTTTKLETASTTTTTFTTSTNLNT